MSSGPGGEFRSEWGSSVAYFYNKNAYLVILGRKNRRKVRDFELQSVVPLIAATNHCYPSKFIFNIATLLFIVWFLFTVTGVLHDCGYCPFLFYLCLWFQSFPLLLKTQFQVHTGHNFQVHNVNFKVQQLPSI